MGAPAAVFSSPLKGSFRAALQRRGQAQTSVLCAASCTLTLNASTCSTYVSGHGTASSTSTGGRGSACGASVEGQLLVPDVVLSLSPLLSKRLCDVPLALALSGPGPQGLVQVSLS